MLCLATTLLMVSLDFWGSVMTGYTTFEEYDLDAEIKL